MGIESSIETPFARAVRAVGSQSAFARLIGKSQASVYERLRDGKPLWDTAVLKVEAETGISRYDLRPDLYPREDATTKAGGPAAAAQLEGFTP